MGPVLNWKKKIDPPVTGPMTLPNLVGFALALKDSPRIPFLQKELDNAKLSMVRIIENTRDYEDGIRGCFESHVSAIKRALATRPDVISGNNTEQHAKYVLIVEDDVVFDETRGDIKDAMLSAMSALDTEATDCVGIGGLVISRMGAEIVKGVRPCTYQCTHAYMLSRAVAEKVAKTFTYKKPTHKTSYGYVYHFPPLFPF